jgi:hypothetical protein
MVSVRKVPDIHDRAQYLVEPDTPELRAVLDAVRSWSRVGDLCAFAEHRHGFGNSDGGFGVSYFGDLDDFERTDTTMREGDVLVYAFFGPPEGYEFVVPESLYLECLAAYLDAEGRGEDAERVRAVLRN